MRTMCCPFSDFANTLCAQIGSGIRPLDASFWIAERLETEILGLRFVCSFYLDF